MQTLDVLSPYTGEVIETLQQHGSEELAQMLDTATALHKNRDQWLGQLERQAIRETLKLQSTVIVMFTSSPRQEDRNQSFKWDFVKDFVTQTMIKDFIRDLIASTVSRNQSFACSQLLYSSISKTISTIVLTYRKSAKLR